MKKISVIIIIYKVKDYLRQCLDSVTSQTYKNLEIVAVAGKDKDGGDDGCEDICREYAAKDERIKIITCAAAGVSDARNRGLEAATGDLIGFVDSDDYTDPDMFEHLISLMDEKNADISVCGRYYEFVNKTLSDSPLPDGPKVMDARDAMEMILSGTGFYLHSWDKLYKKELWDGITFPIDSYVEDRIVIDKVLGRANRIVYDPTPKYHYRERKGSMSKSGDVAAHNHEANLELSVYIKSNFPELCNLVDKYMLYECITAIQNVYLSSGKGDIKTYRGALNEYEKTIRDIDPENKNPLIRGDKKLRLKRFLALYAPSLLIMNTKRRNKQLAQDEVRFT